MAHLKGDEFQSERIVAGQEQQETRPVGVPWLRTNGVNTNGVTATRRLFDGFEQLLNMHLGK